MNEHEGAKRLERFSGKQGLDQAPLWSYLEDKGFASDNSLEYGRQDPAASAPNGDGRCGPKIPSKA